jgi:hypothetical protein
VLDRSKLSVFRLLFASKVGAYLPTLDKAVRLAMDEHSSSFFAVYDKEMFCFVDLLSKPQNLIHLQ